MMRMIGRDSYDDRDTKMNYFLNFNNRDLLDLIFFCNCIIPYSKPSAVGGHPNDDDDDEHNDDADYNNNHNDDDNIDGNYKEDHSDDFNTIVISLTWDIDINRHYAITAPHDSI